jgi:hypothetical protein
MIRKGWTFLTLALVGLNTGGAFAHVLELPGKMRLSAADYLRVQSIYHAFGPVGALLEPGSVLAALAQTVLMRDTRGALPSRVGAACLGAALALWLALVAPMNARFATWTAETIPADWQETRNQWEYTHAARFVLQFTGFCLLLLGALQASGREEPLPEE